MRYFVRISFDGTRYHGWQTQLNASTVQETVNNALTKILKIKSNIVGCGRTDTGVHASYFVFHFETSIKITSIQKTLYQLNAVTPKDIAIKEIVEVSDNYHARFSAIKREYRYYHSFTKSPFLNNYSTQLFHKPNIELLNKCSDIVQQHKDFSSFCKTHAGNKTNICNIFENKWVIDNNLLIYQIKANRFLRNMIRALVGTMLEVGFEKRTLEEFNDIFDAKNRCQAGASADAKGLFLTGVWYDKQFFTEESETLLH